MRIKPSEYKTHSRLLDGPEKRGLTERSKGETTVGDLLAGASAGS